MSLRTEAEQILISSGRKIGEERFNFQRTVDVDGKKEVLVILNRGGMPGRSDTDIVITTKGSRRELHTANGNYLVAPKPLKFDGRPKRASPQDMEYYGKLLDFPRIHESK